MQGGGVVAFGNYKKRRAAGQCGACGAPGVSVARCDKCRAKRRAPQFVESTPENPYQYGGAKPATLEVIAMHMQLTRERVRQIEAEALGHYLDRMVRLGWNPDEALRGLAMLGCLSGEVYTDAPRSIVRGEHC